MSTIDEKYLELGGSNSFLGDPIHEERPCPDGIGRYRTFKNSSGMFSSIHWHPDIGAYETHGAIREKWEKRKWESGSLGYPVTDESDFTTDFPHINFPGQSSPPTEKKILGRFSRFQGGMIVWQSGCSGLGSDQVMVYRLYEHAGWVPDGDEEEKGIFTRMWEGIFGPPLPPLS